jgi:hypothetical protein
MKHLQKMSEGGRGAQPLAHARTQSLAMRFRTYEGMQVFLDLGVPGILILMVLAICIVGTAVWLWRKI